VNRVGTGLAVGGTDIPHIYTVEHSVCLHFTPILLETDKYTASGMCKIRGDCRAVVAHGGVRKQGYDNGRTTPDGVIVVAAFAMVLVSATWVGAAVSLRVAGVVHVLDVLGE